ncbi:uncharacterized protein BKA55DRAFT_570015 [Fusarium redolens]|jgi:hypothetical protein|uniref:F-box domain-containing protein n=1 Tax=Fusarium redolens TaxID=48865 RepID=A0A9P9H1K7_FUSRE|nr:uncharacterized protein BKA55DRAFT_570015 [Fusarium redolens]KAH7248792.1 hypothetical protein BKA55DRAFT_570015 [Fusarium redolens]
MEHHEPVASSSSSQPRLTHLPYELINNIAIFLPREDFKNFRLSCQTIVGCTKPLLALPHFDGVPWRKDGKRLHHLSLIPNCARRIRSIKFNMARLVEGEVEYATSRIINADELHRAWGPYLETQDVFLDPIELPLDLVVPAIMRLPNLDTVCLTWTQCPWQDYRAIDDVFSEEESMELAGDEMLESQQAILDALLRRNVPLKSLTIEPIMHPDLVLSSKLDEKVSTVFGSVTQLHLHLKYDVISFKPDRLDYFISLMPNIRDLKVHNTPVEFEASDVGFYITKRLPHLEKIDLSCLHISFVHFARLIIEHGPTLKEVDLQSIYGWCDPFSSTEIDWDFIFKLMKEKLEVLDTVRINGRFSDNVGWYQIFFRNDVPAVDTIVRVMGEKSGRLEKYILEGGEYPQPLWRI